MPNEDITKLKIDKSTSVSAPSRRRKALYPVIAIIVIALAAAFYFKGTAVEVEVAGVSQIYPSQSFTLLNASGYVVAQRKAAVASKITGRLISINVEEGNHVKKGDIIARLENEDVTAMYEQAKANLASTRAGLEQAKAELHDADVTFNRYKELMKSELVSKNDYDSAEARYKKAVAAAAGAEAAITADKAALSGAEVSLEYTLIRAPFDAVVLTKNADIGDIVTPLGSAENAKAAVVTIADMSSLQVEADVSESNLQYVKLAQPCEIQLDAFPDSRFRGAVHMIVPTADRSKASVMIKVKFLDYDSRILPEMSAKVAFLQRPVKPEEQKPRTVINPAAVVNKGNNKFVFLVNGERVVETQIQTGEQFGDVIEILSGAKAGDKVALKPLEKLRNGVKIKVAEK
ncbi:MAG: efflux RND transporter periplasmic adaptor subunit [Nitrospirae bacterium]|nr:efflux RND transporter periplasmic adaptor subunit [Nitrospirota bacterium]